ARCARISRMHHFAGSDRYRSTAGESPDTTAAISFGLLSAASKCFFNSASVTCASHSERHSRAACLANVRLLHPLGHLHVPSQLFRDLVAQLRRGQLFSVHEVRHARFLLKRVQPLKQLRRVGVIAELLEGGDVRANLHEVTEDL